MSCRFLCSINNDKPDLENHWKLIIIYIHVTHTNHKSLGSILVVSCRTGQHSGDHLLPVVTGLTSWHGAEHMLFWIIPESSLPKDILYGVRIQILVVGH